MPTVLIPSHVAVILEQRFWEATPHTTLRVITYEVDGACREEPAEVEALFHYFPNDRFPGRNFGAEELRRVWERAPRLRWVQTNASGVDGLLFPELLDSSIVVTSGASVNCGPVAESVMALILAIAKRIPQHVRNQGRHAWQRYQKLELCRSRAVVIGYGHIGQKVGRVDMRRGY